MRELHVECQIATTPFNCRIRWRNHSKNSSSWRDWPSRSCQWQELPGLPPALRAAKAPQLLVQKTRRETQAVPAAEVLVGQKNRRLTDAEVPVVQKNRRLPVGAEVPVEANLGLGHASHQA